MKLALASFLLAFIIAVSSCGDIPTADDKKATLSSIAVTPTNKTITAGSTQQFTATGNYSDNTSNDLTGSVTWSSENPGVAAINASGLATAVSAGSTMISASKDGVTGRTTLTVTTNDATLISISVSPANPSITTGSTQQFIATGTYSDNTSKDLTASAVWVSSNPSVATVNASGLAAAVSAGSIVISASKDGVIGNSTLTVTTGAAMQPTRAVLTISTSGTLTAGRLIGGIDISVTLATGVYLKSTTRVPETDDGVVTASGVAVSNSTVLASYSAPSGAKPGTARILIANYEGFGTGDFAVVNCDIAPGSNPKAEDFAVAEFKAKDLNGALIPGLTPGFTADFR